MKEIVIKSDLLFSDTVEERIQQLSEIQEELIMRASGDYPAEELIEKTISNLKKLTVLKQDLNDFKTNLDKNCVVWQNPETQN